MKVALKRCPMCSSRGIARTKVDRAYQVGGVRRVVRGVPAQVCSNCGETFLDLDAAAFVDRALRPRSARRRPRRAA